MEAQASYAAHGWCEEHVALHVRKAGAGDVRDPEWQRVGAADVVERTVAIDGRVDLDTLYYWRRPRA